MIQDKVESSNDFEFCTWFKTKWEVDNGFFKLIGLGNLSKTLLEDWNESLLSPEDLFICLWN